MSATTIIKELELKREAARVGGGQSRIKVQHEKGKLTSRERLEDLGGQQPRGGGQPVPAGEEVVHVDGRAAQGF